MTLPAEVAASLVAAPGDRVNLGQGWQDLWSSLQTGGGFGGIANLLSILGVAIVVFAFLGWAWKKATGRQLPGGGAGGGIGAALVVGSILAAPGVIIPVVLTLFDLLANAVISVFQRGVGGGA